MVIDLEGFLIQVMGKVIEQIVERETGAGPGDGTPARKGGFHFVQCSFYFSDQRDNIDRLLKLSHNIKI